LTETVTNYLLRELRSGGLKPGDLLPSERELMRRTRVGRSSLREALQVLIGMGLIEARPGRGYFVRAPGPAAASGVRVAGLNSEALVDLLDARLILEPEIAALAAKAATPADLAALERALARMLACAERGRPVYRASAEFHVELARTTHNGALIQMLRSLVTAMAQWGRFFEESVPGYAAEEVRLHRALLEALGRGDPDEMRELMREHIAETRRALLAMMRAVRRGSGHGEAASPS
jgi:GntR family transcriptional repressor for pyruvate dehydrogenase complex